MGFRRTAAAALLGAILLAGCASKDNLVVVLPESDGHVGAVVVHKDGGDNLVLNHAYAAAGAGAGSHGMAPVEVTRQETQQIFASALAAQPIPPKSYILYFISDSDDLTPDSEAQFAAIYAEIDKRKAAEIVVTGHTDTFGTVDYNDTLSLARANVVRKLLIAHGLPADSVTAVGRGKRQLLVPTADQVHEPRNRRVEITVR